MSLEISNTINRYELWEKIINKNGLIKICEIGVYKGDFAYHILKKCTSIEEYHIIDPWRNLSNWKKPWNHDDLQFEKIYKEALLKIDFAKEKTYIHRGTTQEIIHTLKNNYFDLIYIDGDHTLRGIVLDLLLIYDKVKDNGFIAGDDFSPNIWQHGISFEPTFVYPFSIYFAEANQLKIYELPFNQFLIIKKKEKFEFIKLNKEKVETSDFNLRKSLISIKKNLPPSYKTYFIDAKRYIKSSLNKIIKT